MDRQIWTGILNADRHLRYYSAVEGKMRQRHLATSFVIITAGSGGAVALLLELPEFVAAGVFAAVAATTIWSTLMNYAGKAAMAEACAIQFGELKVAWTALSYDNEVTQDRIKDLQMRSNIIPRGLDLSEDRGLSQRAERETYELVPHEFAVE